MAAVLLLANVAIRRHYPQIAQLANPLVVQTRQLESAKRALLQRRPDEAIAQLQDVVRQQPDAPEPQYLMGEAYLMQHQPDQAISAFQEALRLDPKYAEAAEGLGAAYRQKGMKPEADAAFKKAAELGYKEE